MLENLKENETKIKILYYSTFLIYFLGFVNLRFKNEIIDVLVAVNIIIILFIVKKSWAKGHEESLKILLVMMLIMGMFVLG